MRSLTPHFMLRESKGESPMPDQPLVQVENVSRDFPVAGQIIPPLRDVSFDVNRGDFVAVIGRSGSGKTTLLNIIAGLDRPTQGRILIDGEDVSAMNDTQ